MANIKNAVNLGVFTLAIMNVTAVVSLRGLPAEAVYGMSSAFYYLFAAIVFLIPTSLVAAELAAMFQDKQGGVFRWVGEAYGKKLGFLAIWVQWIESTIWYAPWTCPKWMKVKSLTDLTPLDSWTNGQLNPAYYQDYATYFVKWVQAFNAEGIDIYAVTPQNEPLNRGNSASLYMSWEEQRDFVKTALGPKFKAAGIATKIYAYDHNYDYSDIATEKNYPGKMYEDAAASQYLAGAAYHNYGGNREELLNIHKAYPEKELLFTETSIGTWNSGRDLSKRLLEDMKEVALGTINNWCRGVIVWNLMLDNDRAPNREGGCQTCYGAVDISNSDYKTIIRNSHYYIIAHLSSVVKPGAVRIGASGYADSNIMYSAFENPDGTYAFVLMNNNEKTKKITLSDGKRHFAYDVPGKSVTSYRWAKSE